MAGFPLLVSRSALPRLERQGSASATRPGLLGMGQPILGDDVVLGLRQRSLAATARAAGADSRRQLGLLLRSEVLAVLAQQTNDLGHCGGGLLLAERRFLLLKLAELLFDLGLGRGDGLQGFLTYLATSPLESGLIKQMTSLLCPHLLASFKFLSKPANKVSTST